MISDERVKNVLQEVEAFGQYKLRLLLPKLEYDVRKRRAGLRFVW